MRQSKTSQKLEPETLDEVVSLKVDQFQFMVTKRVVHWFRNETFFDGFRNTPARILITALSYITLYGGLIGCWITQQTLLYYIIGLVIVLAMQAISVRFVFQIDGSEILDEYHERRRDRAYRRAYKNIKNLVVSSVVIWLVYSYIRTNLDIDLGGWELLTYQRAAAIATFGIGLISLQKYIAYGIKGEPFLSREEVNNLRNS